MAYKLSSTQPILDILSEWATSVDTLVKRIGKGRTIIHAYLKFLLSEGKIIKHGSPPRTTYSLVPKTASIQFTDKISTSEKVLLQEIQKYTSPFSYTDTRILNEIFVKFAPNGKRYTGSHGWIAWCTERWLDPNEKLKSYLKIYSHLQSLENPCGLLSAIEPFRAQTPNCWLDELYYADQYKWMEFGRGRIAEVAFYAKQSQSKLLIQETLDLSMPKIFCLIQSGWFDAIAVTPWSIDRKYQLLKFLKEALAENNLPFLHLVKYYAHGIRIPQKSLKTKNERIENARSTIYIDDPRISQYKKVLLIDDFVGSGATLNETAKKLKEAGVTEVVGWSLVGNLNLSYEVINEM